MLCSLNALLTWKPRRPTAPTAPVAPILPARPCSPCSPLEPFEPACPNSPVSPVMNSKLVTPATPWSPLMPVSPRPPNSPCWGISKDKTYSCEHSTQLGGNKKAQHACACPHTIMFLLKMQEIFGRKMSQHCSEGHWQQCK